MRGAVTLMDVRRKTWKPRTIAALAPLSVARPISVLMAPGLVAI